MLDPIHAQRLEWLAEWNCCGHRFELLLDADYPEQHHFSPICPSCSTELKPALIQWRDRKRYEQRNREGRSPASERYRRNER